MQLVKAMYDARSISNFFIERSLEYKTPVSALSLLKILYFSHAWYLAKFDEPLIGQPFEAWRYGPVNRVVYDQIKGLKGKPITRKLVVLDASTGEFIEAVALFPDKIEIFLSQMFDYYAKFDSLKLSDLTHEQGSPWESTWIKAASGAVPGMIIPNDMIRDWHRNNSKSSSDRH